VLGADSLILEHHVEQLFTFTTSLDILVHIEVKDAQGSNFFNLTAHDSLEKISPARLKESYHLFAFRFDVDFVIA
jgi:hypothetical protein